MKKNINNINIISINLKYLVNRCLRWSHEANLRNICDANDSIDSRSYLLSSSSTPFDEDVRRLRVENKSQNPDFKYLVTIVTTVFTGVRAREILRKRGICGIAETNPCPTTLGSSLFLRSFGVGAPEKRGSQELPPCFCSISKAIYIPPLRGSILRERNFARNTVETGTCWRRSSGSGDRWSYSAKIRNPNSSLR